jgi:dGTPase
VKAYELKTRLSLERSEKETLAAFAISSPESGGRTHTESEHAYRTCFQRDRDRIIHCSAFRRLDAKTQVFYDLSGDYYRTRLTHTLEVAQIARTLARTLAVNEDLAESVALAHDLGHSPYGHCGESVLDKLMAGQGGFEHNAQSLRVVEFLEHPYPDFRGLNLCYETLECMAKHESRYDRPELQSRFGDGQAPLEGQIADLADSIAYNSHDLDDALAYGLISEEDLSDIELYQQLKQDFEQHHPGAHRFARRLRCAKRLIDLLVNDVVQESLRRLRTQSPDNVSDIRRCKEKCVDLSKDCQRLLNQLADFLYEKVYKHPRVAQAQAEAQEQLEFLFNTFVDEPGKLPSRYQIRLQDQPLHRVICDYLAGMTDRFCKQAWLEFKG